MPIAGVFRSGGNLILSSFVFSMGCRGLFSAVPVCLSDDDSSRGSRCLPPP
jgi:hypothetical protein